MLYGIFPWWNAPAPAPFPILPPVTAGCNKCCRKDTANAANIAIVEKEYSYVEFIEPYTWLIEEDAPAGNYTAQIDLGQTGYKRYVDGTPCGEGAAKAKAYLVIQDDDKGKQAFKAQELPAELGLSIPMLALVENGSISSQGPYTGNTVTVVELKNETIYRVYTVRNKENLTLAELLETLPPIEGEAVIYDGTQKTRIKGITHTGLALTLGSETWDHTRPHTTIIGAP